MESWVKLQRHKFQVVGLKKRAILGARYLYDFNQLELLERRP